MKKILILFLLINLAFFHQLFQGLVPLPLDHIAGALYPWHDYKWGYAVNVPIKNPGLSDVFGQLYPWRALAFDIIRSGHLPLWNPYSFSGTPLLANLQSAPFYPLTFILFLLFGNLWGFSLVIFMQPLLSMVFMFLYLRELKISQSGSILGSIVFAFSGFMLTYMELSTASQAFMWLPLMLFLIERCFSTKKLFWLLFLPLVEYAMFTAGHFQASFYAVGFLVVYSAFVLYNLDLSFNKKYLIFGLILGLVALGAALSAIQILPTSELQSLSIRSTDHNIAEYDFGLIPWQNLVTFLAPDYFGNSATYNFWGFLGYQETTVYFGVVSMVLFLAALFIKSDKSNKYRRFYITVFFVSLLMIFNNPISNLVYIFKVPIFSTSYATRLILILNFDAAVVVALNFDALKLKSKLLIKISLCLIGVLGLSLLATFLAPKLLVLNQNTVSNLRVGLKNLLPPIIYLTVFIAILKFVKNPKILSFIIIAFVTLDLFRFGLKFTPFTQTKFDYPKTPVISYLISNIGHFRMERERTEIMPPNTWMPYKLMSPSGYDPLYTKSYANFYAVYDGGPPVKNDSTRYAELNDYKSPFLDLAGVKYMVVAKRDKVEAIDKEGSPEAKFNQARFNPVFQDQSVVVLENKAVLPRVTLFDNFKVESAQYSALTDLYNGLDFRNQIVLDGWPKVQLKKDPSDQVKITSYSENEVDIDSLTNGNDILMLTDSFYPGWKAYVNGRDTKIYLADGVYRAIIVPKGESQIKFIYQPQSFKLGTEISAASLILIGIFFIVVRMKKLEV